MGVGVNGFADEVRDFAKEVLRRLGDIAEALRTEDTPEQLIYVKGNAVTDSNSLAVFTFVAPQDRYWCVEKITATTAAAATVIRSFLDEVNSAGLMDKRTADAAGELVAEGSCLVYVPNGRRLVMQAQGGPAGSIHTLTLRVREVSANEPPVKGMQ
jgi:hypothetical protein